MKLVSYKLKQDKQSLRIGFIHNNKVFDIENIGNRLGENIPSDPAKFFSLGFPVIQQALQVYEYVKKHDVTNEGYQLEDVILGPPNPNPEKIICVGLNYLDHIKEMKSEQQQYPVLFSKFNNSLIGPYDSIEKNPLTNKLDYEVELVVVIGKEASKVSREEAYNYIAGYTIGNDTSARDLQKRTPQWLQGKSLDRSTPIGPWVVTTDELKNPGNINVRSYVNDELRQQSNTKHFIFDIPYLIEFTSHLMTLKPGDLIFTGTPDGVAMGMDSPKFLNDGDIVKMEIENIGMIENKVVGMKE